MTTNYKEVSQGLSKEEAAKYAVGIKRMADFADSLQREGLLPVKFGNVKAAAPIELQGPKIDLRLRTYDLLKHVVEPTDDEKRELREKRGLVFLPMTLQSYKEVVIEHPEHYWNDEVNYANGRPALRDFRPPVAIEVGLIEAELALPGSFRKPRAVALQMIDKYSKDLATEFPGFMAIALPATGYASSDRAYAERNPGQVLFKNFFAWCLDSLSEVRAANAGRGGPSARFGVYDWRARRGNPRIGAVPAVVKIGNK